MRRPFIAGNWKMNTSKAEAVALAQGVVEKTRGLAGVEVAVCPPFPYLDAVAAVVKGTHVGLGAQNVYPEKNGAYTGETSIEMLKDLGAAYVILGHSERRQYFGETDAFINKKVKHVLAHGLVPIFCIGETLQEWEAKQTEKVVETQLYGGLEGVSAEDLPKVVVAYEPVWAIGTGKTATPEQAQAIQHHLRKLLTARYTAPFADQVRIQYGGSMKPNNAKELLAQADIDGGLIGGAALVADQFVEIVKAAV